MWLIVALAQIAPPALPACAASAQLVIADVQVVNVMTGAIEPDRTITIANGRICSISASHQVALSKGAALVDGRGRYVIPGLWDLYAPNTAATLKRLVGYGVTSVYSTSAADQEILEWYRTQRDPYVAAPTLYAAIDDTAEPLHDKFRLDPGADLHEAMELLVLRGVAPIDALRAATLAPASAAGVADQVGTVAVGSEASFLLLEDNPLDDIRHTRSISLMVLRGQTIGLRQLAHLRLAR